MSECKPKEARGRAYSRPPGIFVYNKCMKNLTIPADTTPEAAWVQMQIYRQMPAEKRLLLALEMSDGVREICAAGVRAQYPNFTDEQVRLIVIRRMLGEELFHKAYPKHPPLP